MKLELDTLKFGNPTQAQRKFIEQGNYLNPVFEELIQNNSVLSSAENQKKEINDVIENLKDIVNPENKEALNLYKHIDKNVEQFLYNTLKSQRIDVLKKIQQIASDVDPLVYKLKYFYNRVRPHQIACNLNVKLFPISNSKNDSPSFPSRTVVLGIVVCDVISNLDPDMHQTAFEAKKAIMQSRLYIGNNYQTDVDFAKHVASNILSNEKFLNTYKI